jgi:hypothetical protein
MKSAALGLLVILAATSGVRADDKLVRAKVREVSWTVEVRNADGHAASRGSATLIVDAKGRSWALGCQHVVRNVQEGWSVVVYRQADEDGEKVGRTEYTCEVTRSSEKEDLCLMRVKKSRAGPSARLGQSAKAIPLDEELWHCGTFHGEYDQTVSKGRVLGYGYKIRPGALACDQGDFQIQRGSSGGGVFNAKGELVGVVVWMHGSHCSFYVPSKRVLPWLKSVGAEFIYNPKATVPDNLPPPPKEEKKGVPEIRLIGPFGGGSSDSKAAVVPAPARERKQEAVWLAGDGRGGR